MGRVSADLLRHAVTDPEVIARYWNRIVTVPGSGCSWWTGAIAGRGHGRVWVGRGRVIIAHRLAMALAWGPDAAAAVQVGGHRCDNPLCQRVHPDHVVASSYEENRREWVARRELAGSPLGDPRGARRRARELRDLARRDPALLAAELARLRALYGEQLLLW